MTQNQSELVISPFIDMAQITKIDQASYEVDQYAYWICEGTGALKTSFKGNISTYQWTTGLTGLSIILRSDKAVTMSDGTLGYLAMIVTQINNTGFTPVMSNGERVLQRQVMCNVNGKFALQYVRLKSTNDNGLMGKDGLYSNTAYANINDHKEGQEVNW